MKPADKKKTNNTRSSNPGKNLKKEYPFLYFLAHNPHFKQVKKVVCTLLQAEQVKLLRELAVNELANNIPAYSTPKKKQQLKVKYIRKLKKLARGDLKKHNLGTILDLLQIVTRDALAHHGLSSKAVGHRAGRGVEQDSSQ